VSVFFSSSVSLKCTLSDRQMYPWGYMYPRLGTPVIGGQVVYFGIPSGDTVKNHCFSYYVKLFTWKRRNATWNYSEL